MKLTGDGLEAIADAQVYIEGPSKEGTEAGTRLPDLEQTKAAVLNGLTSASRQRIYDHAIREFVAWYCSEPRLATRRAGVSLGKGDHGG